LGALLTLPKIIAIDGPAASGKSTLGRRLAESLDYLFFDTGVMYRALTWLVLQKGIPVEDVEAVTQLAEQTPIDVLPPSITDGRMYDIFIEGQDVTWKIRSPDVDAFVSTISAYAGVRKAMSALQRQIGLRGRVVMVGRDIGTVILPEADLKIYLDASLDVRAHRRYQELTARGKIVSLDTIKQAMAARDHFDSNRAVAPLRPAHGAIIINSDQLNIDQVLDQVKTLVQQHITEPYNDQKI
jgi:cytidylate kinase